MSIPWARIGASSGVVPALVLFLHHGMDSGIISYASAAAYAGGLAADLYTTARLGREAIGAYETAWPFRTVTARAGVRAAVAAQVCLELLCVMAVIPYVITYGADPGAAYVGMLALAPAHACGAIHNVRAAPLLQRS